jgi:hypothetical protein
LYLVDLDNLKSKKVGAARLVGRSRPTKSQLESKLRLRRKKQKLKSVVIK